LLVRNRRNTIWFSKIFKGKNPDIKVIGVDADGSILKSYHETGEIHKEDVHPYQIEGMGKI
jgi:cystathionine beta-synthase